MKDKIILFVIGVLVGAVIATGAFLIYTKSSCNSNNHKDIEIKKNTSFKMPNRRNDRNIQPPEIPNNKSQNNS